MEKCAQSTLQLSSELVVALGIWTLIYEPLVSGSPVRCLGVLFLAQCLVQQWVHAMRQLLFFRQFFL